MSIIKSIAVFCGSQPGRSSLHMSTAKELGKILLRKKIGLIYGGGNGGLMGAVAQTVHNGGGRVTGIIPTTLGKRSCTKYLLFYTKISRKMKTFFIFH